MGAIRNLKKQSINLKGIEFKNCSFLDIQKDEIKNFVIYCDIPYKGTLKYSTSSFPYDEFYEWAKEMAKHNTVLISEYDMPNGFECIWEKQVKVGIDSNKLSSDEKSNRIERLYIVK